MANTHYAAYGGTCPACALGRAWISPAGGLITLCAEHEVIVAGAAGWHLGQLGGWGMPTGADLGGTNSASWQPHGRPPATRRRV